MPPFSVGWVGYFIQFPKLIYPELLNYYIGTLSLERSMPFLSERRGVGYFIQFPELIYPGLLNYYFGTPSLERSMPFLSDRRTSQNHAWIRTRNYFRL